jgi:hypothetical protein
MWKSSFLISASFVEKASFLPMHILSLFVKNQMAAAV